MFIGSNLVLQWVPGSGKVVRGDAKMSPGVLLRGVRFSISYLVLELQSFEDAKIKAKGTDTKHAILVTSHILNKYSSDS